LSGRPAKPQRKPECLDAQLCCLCWRRSSKIPGCARRNSSPV